MNVPPEAHFAQRLASNQPQVRETALKKIGIWFKKVSDSADSLDEDMLLRLWKGLFYYFWHCDKMLVQEDRADVMSKYIHVFESTEYSFMYVDTFFQTMTLEWHGIDRYRLEKFMMLIRKFMHQCYQLLKNLKWAEEWMTYFFKVLDKTVLNPSEKSAPFGLKCHVSDIYMEELAKVGSTELTSELVEKFLIPYCNVLCKSDDPTFMSSVKKDVFLYLINQDAEEDCDESRFPILEFDANAIQKLLLQYANIPDLRRKNLKTIHSIVKQFEDYKNDICLGDKLFSDQSNKRKIRKRAIEKASLALLEENQKYSIMKKVYKKKKRNEEVDLDEI